MLDIFIDTYHLSSVNINLMIDSCGTLENLTTFLEKCKMDVRSCIGQLADEHTWRVEIRLSAKRLKNRSLNQIVSTTLKKKKKKKCLLGALLKAKEKHIFDPASICR